VSRVYRFPGLALRRTLLAGLVLSTAAVGAWLMLGIVSDRGLTLLEIVIVGLFVPTFAWISIPFWISAIGALLLLARRDPNTLAALRPAPATALGGSRVALVIPIFDEDPDAVSARASAMLDGVGAAGWGGRFDLHLLSDSRNDDVAAREVERVEALRLRHPGARIAYRRRAENVGRKAGNIAEFCARCGNDYDFMVVLDADSLMAGTTLVEMVRRMEANPRLGLLQTATAPIRAESLFARAVQFGATLYGTPLAWGQAFWQGDAANYWGHNAIIRVAPFRDHARLPELAGRPPLGGEILSHDFVEAALLRRAGWQVVFDPTLEASWEEVPDSLPSYARRDRRWAQGSLQHLRLVGLPGLHPASRMHLLLGAMAYLSSVMWFAMLVAGSAYVLLPGLSEIGPLLPGVRSPVGAPSLLVVTAVVLLLPKALGFVHAAATNPRGFGGRFGLVASAVLETAISVLVAPVLMVYHTLFVAQIVRGRDAGWKPWVRDTSEVSWRTALRATAPAWLLGVAWTGVTLALSPAFALWLSPIFAGLVAAAPIVRWTSGGAAGARARRAGLFLVPPETLPRPEVRAVLRSLTPPSDAAAEIPLAPRPEDPPMPIGVTHPTAAGAMDADAAQEGVMYNAERGLFDLRRGRMLRLGRENGDEGTEVLAIAVEYLDDIALRRLLALGTGEARLVVTHHRARTLGWIPGDGDDVAETLRITLDRGASAADVRALATEGPGGAAAVPVVGEPATPECEAALSLARIARLVPAVVTVAVGEAPSESLTRALVRGEILWTSIEEVERYVEFARSEIVRVSEAPVPIPGAEDSRFVLYREACGLDEHVAVLVGDPASWPDPVPIRIHSACFTGDIFGSLRCDCGEQLQASVDYFATNGGGILLYLAQEGRGIGLGNKFRAYSLQEHGLDTIDADGTLGFGADERSYEVAVRIFEDLGVDSVELLTNNPEKLAALERAGIRVARRTPLFGHLNRHNLPYVRAKVERAGHWLRDMLGQPLAGD
jgi:membrane glycosyltransferase